MLHSWEEFDSTLRSIATIDIQVSQCVKARDKKLLELQNTHKNMTEPLLDRKKELEGELEAFYKAHRKEVEASGKRSKDMLFGRAGMRKGQPRLALMKGWKWEKVLEAIKDRWRRSKMLGVLVKTKETVNKDALKADLSEEQLAEIGVRVRQSDEFFYETFPEKVTDQVA